jgi:hypothetical protein
VRTDRPIDRNPALGAKPSTDQWLTRISHPNGFWRDAAQRNLVQQADPSAIPALRALTRADKNPSPLGRLQALWTLVGSTCPRWRARSRTATGGSVRPASACWSPFSPAPTTRPRPTTSSTVTRGSCRPRSSSSSCSPLDN